MVELSRHRRWLILHSFSAMLGFAFVVFSGDVHVSPRTFATLLAICWVIAVVSYVGLIFSDTRLAAKVGVEFKPLPLWFLYLLSGAGLFISLWLDLKASRARSSRDMQ
ncbi:MAG: hypothetical protein EOO81_06380 [Oxalobacteraceae bacterium]|nr:MAG: hypothetical protein EOO81_06380 [Oxalobacteraceae bacterium]